MAESRAAGGTKVAIQNSGIIFSLTPALSKKLKEMRKVTAYQRAAAEVLKPVGEDFAQQMRENISEDFDKGTESGIFPRRRSQELYKSIGYRTLTGKRENLGTLRIGVLSRRKKILIKANVQEFGKTIKKRPGGPRLTVPLDAAMNAKGIKKFSAWDVDKKYAGGSFEARSILFGKRKSGAIVPVFKLQEKVVVPPRPFVEPLKPEIRKVATQILRNLARRIVK
jgi:hypothetical protein